MKVPWNSLSEKHKKMMAVAAVLVMVASLMRCAYWYTQWTSWHGANEALQPYTGQDIGAISREMWKDSTDDVLAVLQQSEQWGIQIVSAQNEYKNDKKYMLETKGTYENYIRFLNEIEKELPNAKIEVIQMERKEDIIECKLRIS